MAFFDTLAAALSGDRLIVVLVSAIGALISVLVQRAGVLIARQQGQIQFLEFAHQRIRSVNFSSRQLAADLEELVFQLEKMVQATFDLRADVHRVSSSVTTTEQSDELERRIKAAIGNERVEEAALSDAQRSLRSAYHRFASIAADLPESLRAFAQDPFVIAADRVGSSNAKNSSLAAKVNGMIGRQRYQSNPLGIARLMSEASDEAADRLLFLMDAFDSTPYDDRDLLGLMFDCDFYRSHVQQSAGKDAKFHRIERIVVNSGMVHLAAMYSLIPSRTNVSALFERLTNDQESGGLGKAYAELTSVDLAHLVDQSHLNMFKYYNERPERLVIVGVRKGESDDENSVGQIVWERYNEQEHGPLAALNAH